MQMHNKIPSIFLFILFFTAPCIHTNTLLKNALEIHDNMQNTRAFDLYTGSTSGVTFGSVVSGFSGGSGAESYSDCHPTGKWVAAMGGSNLGYIYDFSIDGTAFYIKDSANVGSIGDTKCIAWNPAGNYLLHGGTLSAGINGRLSAFDQNTGIRSILSSNFDITYGGVIYACIWHPNGKYFSVGGQTPDAEFLVTYSFDSNSIYKLPDASVPFTFSIIRALDWSIDGKYVAMGADQNIYILYFNEDALSFTEIRGARLDTGGGVYSIKWHPFLPILAVGTAYNGSFTDAFYYFDGLSLTLMHSYIHNTVDNYGGTGITRVVEWSPDGAFVASGHNFNTIQIRPFQITNLTALNTILLSYNPTDDVSDITWSPDRSYFIFSTSGTTKLRSREISVSSAIEIKKVKKELLYAKKLFTATSNKLPLLYETVINTSITLNALLTPSLSKTLLIDNSFAINGLSPTLVIENSNALIVLQTLNVDNSTSLVGANQLSIDTSNAIAGLLLKTSQAANSLLIPNSQALVTINNLSINNSNALISIDTPVQANSNTLVTYQPLIVQNSNALNGLLVDTSNATAGLLVDTSNAAAGLLVDTSNAAYANALKAARLDTIDTGPAHVHFNSASITMSYNLLLSTDHQLFVHTSGVVNGNGHSITFARGEGTQITVDAGVTTTFQNVIFKDYNDQAVSLGSNASLIFGNQSRVELSEPQTLLRTWSFAGISQLNGLGNALTLGTGPLFLSSLVSSSLQLSNLKLLNVRENNIRAANNNSAINFQDVTLNMSADYTYSIGSITVQNDLTLHGTSTFNYTTIMGCTVNPASQLTVDQGMKLNYAPAGNFRNLLSLTDSSARLFFNNATLVATPTGPQLTKGTMLVDGIMNIQSAAASSAEAITFGDSTPNNDLIINIFPGAGINLKTGFLNYANAN